MMQPEVCPMTADRYARTLLTLLTIIAACLLLQTLLALDRVVEARQQPPYPQAGVASNVPQRVIIVGWDAGSNAKALPLPVVVTQQREPLPVVVTQQRDPVPVTLTHPVKLADTPLSVSIDAVRKSNYPWDTVNVHVEDRKSLPE